MAVLIFVVLTFTSGNTTDRTVSGNCPMNCTCKTIKIVCSDYVPDSVPDTVEELEIDLFGFELMVSIEFCDLKARHLKRLTVMDSMLENFGNIGFSCIQQLEILELKRVSFMPSFSWRVNNSEEFFRMFSNLSNVKELEFSECRFELALLTDVLSSRYQLPKLTHLRLLKSDIYINQAFIDALFERPVEVLDLSNSQIVFDFQNPGKLCGNLVTLKLQGSDITEKDIPEVRYKCEKLQVVDWSYSSYFSSDRKEWPCSYYEFPNVPWIFMAPIIYFDNTYRNPEQPEGTASCAFAQIITETCPMWVLHFSGNSIPAFRFFFPYHFQHLEQLDLSNNKIISSINMCFNPYVLWTKLTCRIMNCMKCFPRLT